MSEVYKQPDSNLVLDSELALTFSSLGIWRKIYVVFNWISAIAAGLYLISQDATGSVDDMPILYFIGIMLAAVGYCFWLQYAIVKRNLTQLMIIGIINIFPFFNPIAALLVFLIRSTSKKELVH